MVKKLTEQHKKRIGAKLIGHKVSFETRNKISKSLKGRHVSIKSEFKKGWNAKEKHPRWKGGVWKKGYTFEFDNDLKEKVRKRDNYCCQECCMSQNELRQRLDIHHIDFNKKHNSLNNLISLCRSCHSTIHIQVELNKKISLKNCIAHLNGILNKRLVKS